MSIDDEVRALSAVAMFKGVPADQLRLLAMGGSRLVVAPGDYLFEQGAEANTAYLVLDGRASIEVRGAPGAAPVKVAEIGRHSFVGEMGVISGAPRSADVRAIDALTTWEVSGDLFLELIASNPAMALAVMRDLARRLERTTAALVRQSAGGG
jgi:CRP-like cAMP-binding protein